MLNRVAGQESITVDDGAVAMIARSAQGSFRDALGTLDQLVAFGGNDVGLDEVLEMLGAADADLLFEAVDAVVASDPKAVLLGVEKMARSGRDPSQFARDLLAHLRHPAGHPDDRRGADHLRRHRHRHRRGSSSRRGAVGAATLVRTIDELAGALTAVREGDDARMAVEIALLKAARPDLDPSTEGLLRADREAGARSWPAAAPPPDPDRRRPRAPSRPADAEPVRRAAPVPPRTAGAGARARSQPNRRRHSRKRPSPLPPNRPSPAASARTLAAQPPAPRAATARAPAAAATLRPRVAP